ncbi:MAG TPA: S8 family peptidase [Thermodesulfobacteriota bacterium]
MATLGFRMLGLAGALLVVGGAQASTPPLDLARGLYVPGEILVRFRPGTDSQMRAHVVGSRGDQVLREVGRSGVVRVKLAPGQTVAAALDAYQRDPDVAYVQPNYRYRAFAVPNDPQYGQLWGLRNTGQSIAGGSYASNNPGVAGRDMGAEAAWDLETDCSSVVVAVLDTGVNYDHEDLAPNMWNGLPNHGDDFIDGDGDPMDEHGHGTHVAGTIGAVGNNGIGTTGVCWRVQLMAVRVLDAAGSGTTASIAAGIDFAVTEGAKVINLSLGGPSSDAVLSSAILRARDEGVVVVAAAGNEGSNNNTSPRYPCNFAHDNIVCVAALDQAYGLASFSNYGSTTVDVGAPGTNILSTWSGIVQTFVDDFNTGGVLDWTAAPVGGWAYASKPLGAPGGGSVTMPMLLNPSMWPDVVYGNNRDDRVYKTFDLAGVDAATVSFAFFADTEPGADFFRVAYSPAGGDPFAGGTLLESIDGSTDNFSDFREYDIADCVTATCTIGFQLLTDSAGQDLGVGIFEFGINTLQLDTARYEVVNGTSMAAPHVSGLAALLFAYNPEYGYLDVVESIKNGGTPVAVLTDRTTTGRAANAMGSLAYIRPPTGVVATPEP